MMPKVPSRAATMMPEGISDKLANRVVSAGIALF